VSVDGLGARGTENLFNGATIEPDERPLFMREAELIPQAQSLYTTVRASLL
jgi:hypothetical protein